VILLLVDGFGEVGGLGREAYQGDDFHESPKGEKDSEKHVCGCALAAVATRKSVGKMRRLYARGIG